MYTRHMRMLLISILLLWMTPGAVRAQQWSGILDSSRAIDWSHAGISGGIPNRTTICATLNPGATSAQINSAIASCPAGQVVFLNSGTYSLSAGIDFNGHANVSLRGAGPGQTVLQFTGGTNCGGNGGDLCVEPAGPLYNGNPSVLPGGSQSATWSGGYSKGSTQITLTANSGLPSVGQVIVLDQANDTSDTGGVFVCDTPSSCQQSGPGNGDGRVIGGVTHSQQQLVTVTSVNGSTLTITPGLYANNWRSTQSPGAWWTPMISQVGIENLTVDHSASTSVRSGIFLYSCTQCWVKNVESLNANRNHVWLYLSNNSVVRDSYFYGTQNAASQSYGVETYETADDLIENNIFQHVASPVMSAQGMGLVVAYNYAVDNYYTPSINWLLATAASHNAGNSMNLFEGNEVASIECDDEWGTSNSVTIFRNQLFGRGLNGTTTTSLNTQPITLMSYCRAYNVVGNVLGTPGYHTQYESSLSVGTATNCDHTIFQIGFGGTECGNNASGGVPNDSLAASTLLRWGNYDVVKAAAQWNTSEVPTKAAQFLAANAVPSTQSLPPSFYLSSKPSWWGSTPWPAVGPDVLGGTISGLGGLAYLIPAQLCYNSTTKNSNGVLLFDANKCYLQGPLPAAPTNLTVVVH